MDIEWKWTHLHLKSGCIIYLIDLIPDITFPSGTKRMDLKCELIEIKKGLPIWLRLKLIEPEEYPDTDLGLLVDELVITDDGDFIITSFRDLKSLMKHIYIFEPVQHLDPPSLRLAEIVFEDIWNNLYVRLKSCPKGKSCTDEDIEHLAIYSHS